MPIRITTTETLKPEFAHWFLYGRMRSGKTRAAATFPRPFFIVPYHEGSHVALMGKKDIDFVLTHGSTGAEQAVANEPGRAYSMSDILDELEGRYMHAAKIWKKAEAEEDGVKREALFVEGDQLFPWQTVVVESITHYTDLVQEELTRGNTIDMDYQKWGKLSAHLRSVHARLRALPVHVVFISLSIEHFDQKGNLTGGGPAFPGAMKYKLPSACDCVVFMEHREGAKGKPGRYTAHFRTHKVFDAGCRFPQLTEAESLVPFTFESVQKLLGGSE